jgi:hypothetical protein
VVVGNKGEQTRLAYKCGTVKFICLSNFIKLLAPNEQLDRIKRRAMKVKVQLVLVEMVVCGRDGGGRAGERERMGLGGELGRDAKG